MGVGGCRSSRISLTRSSRRYALPTPPSKGAHSMTDIVSNIVDRDLFRRSQNGEWAAGQLVGRPFKLEYATACIATPDAWKLRAGGIPQGCFLLAFYDHEHTERGAAEAVLLRVLGPT